MVYSRVHDHTVADDYCRAMVVIEDQLDSVLEPVAESRNGHGCDELRALVEALEATTVEEEQQRWLRRFARDC